MENIQFILLIVQIVIAVLMIILVLFQKTGSSSLRGIGGGSGGMDSAISSKASANAITKFIMMLVAIFMANSLIMATISARINNSKTLKIDKAIEKKDYSPMVPIVPPID